MKGLIVRAFSSCTQSRARAASRARWCTAARALAAVAFLSSTGIALAAGSDAAARITQPIDASHLVVAGGTPALAKSSVDLGAVDGSLPLEHLHLQLTRSAEAEQALETRIVALQDPTSDQYHHWLTADELGEKYGPAEADIAAVEEWLTAQGLTVNGVTKNGLTIDFSGSAATVSNAFRTEIHAVEVNGQRHITNVTSPKIPAALASVVAGIVSLNDFKPKSLMVKPKSNFTIKCTGCPDGFDGLPLYLEAPADFATIYNVAPVYKERTGKGVTVVVLEDTDIQEADYKAFRTAFGLTSYAGTFSEIHPGSGCADPGYNGAEGEAALDAEWAGAIAPGATVHLASCADTTTNFGAFIAAQNLLDSTAPPAIMSLSYLTCEAQAGPGPNGNGYVYGLWQQAAAEGVSVFVSAGDGGAAGCDDFDTAPYATAGIAANAFASTPYDTATGGTDFLDTSEGTVGNFWKSSNSTSEGSAKSYIPETPWNDTCAGKVFYEYIGYSDPISSCNSALGSEFIGIVGGSGAPSYVYAKPTWQKNTFGNPNDGARDLPDVSLFASNGFWSHAIVFCMSDPNEGGAPCNYKNPTDVLFNSAGGTSFTAPQFASIQALIDEKAGGPQGNAAPIYYKLAQAEYGTASKPNTSKITACNSSNTGSGSSACVFHDVTYGDNDVPCFGPVDCYNPDPTNDLGVLSTSDTKLAIAYPAYAGWDFATGLGTVNVANLVNAWP